MKGFKAILIGVLGVLFLGGLVCVYAGPVESTKVDSNTKMRHVSGEISWIDVKLGKLKLNSDAGQVTRGITEYDLNQDETRVVDPADKKFLALKDLRAGQHVTIELINGPDETIARKIIAEPMSDPVFQEVTGELEAIDVQAGTLIIEEKPLSNEEGKENLSYFVFDPKDIVIMKAPSIQLVQLELKPGDLVKVEFVARDGKRHAHSITLLSTASETTSTTTTMTTSTTVIK